MENNSTKVPVNIRIENCNVQVVPNADAAVQNFYGDQFVPNDCRRVTSTAASQSEQTAPPDETRSQAITVLRVHIRDVARLEIYLDNLSACQSASDLAEVVVTMRKKEGWPNEVEIVKERFINLIKVLAPNVTKGNSVSNIRARIKDRLGG